MTEVQKYKTRNEGSNNLLPKLTALPTLKSGSESLLSNESVSNRLKSISKAPVDSKLAESPEEAMTSLPLISVTS